MTSKTFVAANWASNYFRAFLVNEDAAVIDQLSHDRGIIGLTRADMEDVIVHANKTLKPTAGFYLAGMVGSDMGWEKVPYCECPSTIDKLASNSLSASIGNVDVSILPGLCVTNSSHGPDVMRGEEVELFGALNLLDGLNEGTKFIVLAGRHSKWVKLENGKIVDFLTSMSGELFDSLRDKGLLSALMKNQPQLDDAFWGGLLSTKKRPVGLGRELFGVRAKVMTGALDKEKTSSYAHGLFLGAEIIDAVQQFPELNNQTFIPVIGKQEYTEAYLHAMSGFSLKGRAVDVVAATVNGFSLYHSTFVSLPAP
ncbi:2-dehydro-3-deoxygalactonokinase [Hirschia litorea]|uniref:2-dehydro-3-deoxygalactonokinase n=1 Tax=Hirschia litorea TaxID=1199156 RepID=A0ABW2IPH7_9PROT